MRTSHDYAKKLKELAVFLEERPPFDIQGTNEPFIFFSMTSKNGYTAARSALGGGEPKIGSYSISVEVESPRGTSITIKADKETVGKKISEEKWEFPE